MRQDKPLNVVKRVATPVITTAPSAKPLDVKRFSRLATGTRELHRQFRQRREPCLGVKSDIRSCIAKCQYRTHGRYWTKSGHRILPSG